MLDGTTAFAAVSVAARLALRRRDLRGLRGGGLRHGRLRDGVAGAATLATAAWLVRPGAMQPIRRERGRHDLGLPNAIFTVS